jgi:hypothetical protein
MLTVPFSAEDFFGVFAAYNEFIWPAQVLLTVAAAGVVALTFRRSRAADRWVAGFLAFLWLWTGVIYHLLHFRTINPAAAAFGALFVLQALLFFWWGVVRGRLSFAPAATLRHAVAAAILLYALGVYPLLGALQGHAYLASPTFGAPCPAVIYTFGILLLARSVPFWLLITPGLWALIGSSAVYAFGVVQDLGLLASAIATFALLTMGRRHERRRAALAALH